MADVDMADAPPAKTKVAKAGASAEGDKKRFEVKKVGTMKPRKASRGQSLHVIVECRSSLGMGHRRRQLRHLS